MAKQDNNRTRVSIPVSGLDTSTPDLTVADGKCEELHNLRWEAGSWHNIDPVQIKHQLHATEENAEWFNSLTIRYHHPAAGDNVYIASTPNDDGTINLLQVAVKNDSLVRYPENINPIYIHSTLIDDVENLKQAIYLCSLYPVATDVSVKINYADIDGQEQTSTLKIAKGNNWSDSYIVDAYPQNNDHAKPNPEHDDTYTYLLFPSKEAAESGGFILNIPTDVLITHFGNILIITNPINKQIIIYHFNNYSYDKFIAPAPPVIEQNHYFTGKGITPTGKPTTKIKVISPEKTVETIKFFNITNGAFYFPIVDKEFFWGEVCYFAVFQMYDGNLISPSLLCISASEPSNCSKSARTYIEKVDSEESVMQMPRMHAIQHTVEHNGDAICYLDATTDGNVYSPTVFGFMISPYITISISENIDTDLIKNVNIYSTRINPIWDSIKLKTMAGGDIIDSQFKRYFADNRLPDQPFYFAKSIPIDQFKDKKYNMYLDATLLKDIEQNQTYQPIEAHSIYYNLAKEYNSRWNVGGDIHLDLFEGFGSAFFKNINNEVSKHFIVTDIRIDDITYHTKTLSSHLLSNSETFVNNKIISYPDCRAISMRDAEFSPDTTSHSIKLTVAQNNNYSYATCGNDFETVYGGKEVDYVKYSSAFSKVMTPGISNVKYETTLVPQCNKIRISAPSNPIHFPMENSYAIGTENNRILAVNSAAIEMSDAKFGEFPLYVFTDEGIFTLQSGSGEVLYSATIPLNYDKIINPQTLAVNHNILYVTVRGIQAMFSNESKLISESLNDRHNMPPLDYLRTATMCYHPAHNEVIVWNSKQSIGRSSVGTRAYVYSLDGGYWFTRDLEGEKLNTAELVTSSEKSSITIFDLDTEKIRPDKTVPVRIVSRPIKLGSAEYKRLETYIARLRTAASQPMRLVFEGSADLKTWITLRDTDTFSANGDVTIRRFPCSARYLRVTLEATISSEFELAQFDVEYYLRFLHRLR